MHRTSIGILAALCVLSSTLALTRTQTPPPGTSRGSLEGLVIDTVTGQPIEGVQIAIVPGQALTEAGVRALLEDQKPTLQVPQITTVLPGVGPNVRDLIAERTAHSVLTDARGKFMFNSLAAGTYSLALRAEGYNFQVYGRKTGSLGSLPVNIGEGKTDAGVVRMNP